MAPNHWGSSQRGRNGSRLKGVQLPLGWRPYYRIRSVMHRLEFKIKLNRKRTRVLLRHLYAQSWSWKELERDWVFTGVQHSSSAGAKLEGSSFARANLKRASGLSLRGCGTQVLQVPNLRDQVSHLQNLSFAGTNLDYHVPHCLLEWIKFAH